MNGEQKTISNTSDGRKKITNNLSLSVYNIKHICIVIWAMTIKQNPSTDYHVTWIDDFPRNTTKRPSKFNQSIEFIWQLLFIFHIVFSCSLLILVAIFDLFSAVQYSQQGDVTGITLSPSKRDGLGPLSAKYDFWIFLIKQPINN